MKVKLICYPNCSTCRKTQKYLESKGIEIDYQNIKTQTPSSQEIKEIHQRSDLPIKRLFNTSGQSYRNLNLKETFDNYTDNELYDLLANDGMLLKRPIIMGDHFVLIGFKEEAIDEVL